MKESRPSVDTILAEAVEIADAAERQAFVERSCAGDAALQRRVEGLIVNHFRAGRIPRRFVASRPVLSGAPVYLALAR
jgi:hypothetical protein